jgi:hypothetical protein
MWYFQSGLMLTLLASVLVPTTALADVQRKKFTIPHAYLVVEVLDDNLMHFELSAIGPGPSESDRLYTSPMILKTDYPGASTFNLLGQIPRSLLRLLQHM